MFDNLSDFSIGGACLAAVTWVWKKMSFTDKKLAALELKMAETYVTRPELKAVEEKIDHLRTDLGNKVDRVNDNLLLLLKQ